MRTLIAKPMTYRNDLDAAHARIESLERENRALEQELARRDSLDSDIGIDLDLDLDLEHEHDLDLDLDLDLEHEPDLDLVPWSKPAPMAMEPVRRASPDLGDLLGAARIVIFLFVVLYAVMIDFAR